MAVRLDSNRNVKEKDLLSHSIRFKLILSYLLVIIIPYTFVGISSIYKLSDSFTQQTLASEQYDLKQVGNDVKYQLDACIDLSREIVLDDNIWNYFHQTFAKPVDSISGFYSIIRPTFAHDLTLRPEFDRLSVYTNNTTILCNNYEIYRLQPQTERQAFYSKLVRGKGIGWAMLQEDGQKRLVLGRILNYGNISAGMLNISFKDSTFSDIFDEQGGKECTYLVNPDGIIVASTEKGTVGLPFQSINIPINKSDPKKVKFSNGVRWIFTSNFSLRSFPDENWLLVKTAPLNSITNATMQSTRILVLGFFLLLLFIIFVSITISNAMNKRVGIIVSGMKQIKQGVFGLHIAVKGHDELSFMSYMFNSMTDQLDGLMHQVLQLQINQKNLEIKNREMQLVSLKHQINPHFLFNTLDAIMFGIHNHMDETENIVALLSDSFRRILVWKSDMIPLKEEMVFINEYLTIQKFRMQDKLDWAVEIPDTLMDYCVPKMLIQPIVENAVTHGIAMKKEGGGVFVKASAQDEKLHVLVGDNGAGFSKDKLDGINKYMADANFSEEQQHIGLKNVYSRLKLYYGVQGELRIKSNADNTLVEITMPLQRYRE